MRFLLRAPAGARPGQVTWAWWFHWYPGAGLPAEQKLALALIGGTLAADLVWVVRWRDGRGRWAALLLLPPAALLWFLPHAYPGGSPAPWQVAAVAAVVAAASAAVIVLAVKLNGVLGEKLDELAAGRLSRLLAGLPGGHGHAQGQCPACGQPLPSPAGLLPAMPADQQRGMGAR